jgi:apolipoprotein N-acyltransferase
MARLVKAWPCFVSAALFLLAFPPFNLGLLAMVALVPWLVSLRKTDGKQAWRSGYCLGFLLGLGQLYWIGVLGGRWTGSLILGVFPWVLAAAIFALYFAWTGVLVQRAWSWEKPWLIPLAWVGIEVFRSFVPVFAFPWAVLAEPLWLYLPFIQSAWIGTIYLVSAWAVLCSVLVAMAIEGDAFRRLRPLLYAFVAILFGSGLRYAVDDPTDVVRVKVGQPGVDMAFGNPSEQPVKLARAIQPMLDAADRDGTQLVVLPEGISDARQMPPSTPFRVGRTPVLFGARRGVDPTFQSAIGWDQRWKHVDKTRLVIFGEFVPGRTLFPFITDMFQLPAGDLSAGTEGVQSMDIAGTRVGPVICFESLFSDITYKQALNNARILAVLSIDDWYMGTAAPEQLRANTVWRAIETGLPTVRSASLGHSMAVDGRGRLLARVPLKQTASFTVDLPVPRKRTVFLLSPLFPALALLGAAVLTIWPVAKRARE